MDMGVSPFIQTYTDRSLVHALVKANQVDLLRELLSHEFSVLEEADYNKFKKSVECVKDERGDNVFHAIFKLHAEERNEFLKVVFKPEYFVKMT